MDIIRLDSELCKKYKNEISNYIYNSMNRGCKEEWFGVNESISKTEELVVFLKEGKAYSFIALDDKVEGFLWAYPFENRFDIYLSIIYVDINSRGNNVGKQLLETLEYVVKKDGYKKIVLHTDVDNSISRQFYNKMGYKENRIELSKEL